MIAALSAAWAWLAGTRLGRVVAAVAGALAILAAAYLKGLSTGRSGAVSEAREADRKGADDVRKRADDARRRAAADDRSADERLRDFNRLRD